MLRKTVLLLALLWMVSPCVAALAIPAAVTMIEMDSSPAITQGPGALASGSVAFDCNYRSIFIAMEAPTAVSQITLKHDPALLPSGGNANLSSANVELYHSSDNVAFTKATYTFSAPDGNTVVLSGFSITAKFLKIHTTLGVSTPYKFVNYVGAIVPTFTAFPATPYELPDPLYETLLSATPGPDYAFYWSNNCDDELGRLKPWFRAYQKVFGNRYMFDEQLQETAQHHLVYGGKTTSALRAAGISTWRDVIGDPGEAFVPLIGGMPDVFDGQGWMMDPRWQQEYLNRAVARAGTPTDQWALWAGDETWESYAIDAVPVSKRYDYVLQADTEIKQNYGFGIFGMPDGNTDSNPYERIAHRRWVSDKLTDLFRQAYEGAKSVNPNIVMMSPDFASCVPAADIEAWSPYFDTFEAQTANWPFKFVDKFWVGCDTKILADLSEKPVFMAVQNATRVGSGYSITPEDVRETYSQVFRNGGDGIFLLASEWFDRQLNHTKYVEPDKWRAMLDVVDNALAMHKVVLPQADCAILYSSDTLLTLQWGQYNEDGRQEIRSMYTLLGPVLRSWFHFVSDRQIDRGTRNLSNYKVLYVPYGEYIRGSVVGKIEDYVRNGGTLVCTDIDAFARDINGQSLTQRWESLRGVRSNGYKSYKYAATTVAGNVLPLERQLSFSLPDPHLDLSPIDGQVIAIATFADGTPAIIMHTYGSGKVIFFAADPFGLRGEAPHVVPWSPIVDLLKAIQTMVGANLNRDIWRFKLPPVTSTPSENRRCLTNNYVYDRNDPLRKTNNVDTWGSYVYSRDPDKIPDLGKPQWTRTFYGGHLTTRVTAYEQRRLGDDWSMSFADLPTVPNAWIVSWNNPSDMYITFDLKNPYSLSSIKFYYSGLLPPVSVELSTNSVYWIAAANANLAQAKTYDVASAEISLSGNYRFVRLVFGSPTYVQPLELAEVEIWGLPIQ